MGKSKYTTHQKVFVKKMKSKGLTNREICDRFNENPRWEISLDGLRHLVRKVAAKPTGKSHLDLSREISKGKILEKFKGWIVGEGYVPALGAFSEKTGFSAANIKTAFGSIQALEDEVRKTNPELFEDVIDETSFTSQKFSELKKSVAGYQRFFVTTAVTGCKPHHKALAAIKTFCDAQKAKLLILPVSDPANSKPRKYKFALHPDLPGDGVVFRDLKLNSNLYLSTIKLQAKQINPLTGLRSLGQKSSCILASPKQFLEPISISNKKAIPHHLLTPGAITVPEYETKNYVSERTSYLAQDSHILGGIVVEVKDRKTFFYRHVQFDAQTGAFCDLDRQYFPDGKVSKIMAELIQLPDWHVGSTCPVFRKTAKKIVRRMRPKFMTLEDFFDGISINPFERKNMVSKSAHFEARGVAFSLKNELKACSKELDELCTWNVDEIVIKRGNHDDFLLRWLREAEYAHDPVNHHEGVCLAKEMLEGNNPLEHALTVRYPAYTLGKVRFLDIQDSFIINGIENAAHGHLGAGGKRNPGLKGLECFGPCNTGHTHAPGIIKQVFRVGTATKLQLSYNVGASAWSNTLLIQHYDGSRQLVTVIDGEWTL